MDGSFGGTTALLVRSHTGEVWVAAFNGSVLAGVVNEVLWEARWQIAEWPDHDPCDRYP